MPGSAWLYNGRIIMKDGAVVLCAACPCEEEEPRIPVPCCPEGWKPTLYLKWNHGEAVIVSDTSTIPPTWTSVIAGGSHSGTYLGEPIEEVQVFCDFNEGLQVTRVTLSFIVDGSNLDHYYDTAGPFCAGGFPITGGEWTGGGTSTENVTLDEEPIP